MTKRKFRKIKNLEAHIDALIGSKDVIYHNLTELDYVNNLIIDAQENYKRLVGNYYSYKRKEDDWKIKC